MAIGCGAKFSKFILFIFNILFWISGLVLIVTASIYIVTGSLNYLEIIILPNDRSITMLIYMMIGLGCIVFIIGFCGCCGAIRESRFLLGIYIGFVIIIMIAEIVCGVYSVIKASEVKDKMETSLLDAIKINYPNASNYDTHQNLKKVVDNMQKTFECCGVNDYKDWQTSNWYKERDDKYYETPLSCCQMFKTNITRSCHNEQLYFKKGCLDKLNNYIRSKFPILIGILIGIALFEILVVLFAICLCNNTGNIHHSAI